VQSEFPWYAIARAEIGVREVTGSGDNTRIVEYQQSTTLEAPGASQDETPWCSAFANWCVERAGHAGTDSEWAHSWLQWCVPTDAPREGCIVVLDRGAGSAAELNSRPRPDGGAAQGSGGRPREQYQSRR